MKRAIEITLILKSIVIVALLVLAVEMLTEFPRPVTSTARTGNSSAQFIPSRTSEVGVVNEQPMHENPVKVTVPVPDVKVLAQMKSTCEYWSVRANDRRGRVFRDSACRNYKQYANRFGVSIRVPRVSQTTNITTGPRHKSGSSPVFVAYQCQDERFGSIEYRKCRARVKRHMLAECTSRRKNLGLNVAEPYCRVAETYEIVK